MCESGPDNTNTDSTTGSFEEVSDDARYITESAKESVFDNAITYLSVAK